MTARTTIAKEYVNFSLLFLQVVVMFCESGMVVIVIVVPFPLLTGGLAVTTMVPLTALQIHAIWFYKKWCKSNTHL